MSASFEKKIIEYLENESQILTPTFFLFPKNKSPGFRVLRMANLFFVGTVVACVVVVLPTHGNPCGDNEEKDDNTYDNFRNHTEGESYRGANLLART